MQLMLCALALGSGTGAASPLDFLFAGPAGGGPHGAARRLRPHRRPVAPQAVDIPLPPPRPSLPIVPPAQPLPAPAPAPTSAPPTPTRTEAFGPPKPPLPPAKPADVAAPPVPADEPAVAPAAGPPAAETAPEPVPKPPEIAKPGNTKPDITKPDAIKPSIAKPGPNPAPAVAPSGATTAFTPRAPADDPQCPSRLVAEHIGVETTTIGPQPDARCTIVEPVRLTDVTLADGSKVIFPEHPTIACETADSFGSYVRDLLVPLAKGTFGAPVTAVWTGPGLECRSRDSVFGAKLSAHGQGLAIDIAQLKLSDGRLVEVGSPKTDAETAFETAARAGACGYFHTVLGPGSDAYHRTHWHFDLEVRGTHGDTKFCK